MPAASFFYDPCSLEEQLIITAGCFLELQQDELAGPWNLAVFVTTLKVANHVHMLEKRDWFRGRHVGIPWRGREWNACVGEGDLEK